MKPPRYINFTREDARGNHLRVTVGFDGALFSIDSATRRDVRSANIGPPVSLKLANSDYPTARDWLVQAVGLRPEFAAALLSECYSIAEKVVA